MDSFLDNDMAKCACMCNWSNTSGCAAYLERCRVVLYEGGSQVSLPLAKVLCPSKHAAATQDNNAHSTARILCVLRRVMTAVVAHWLACT